MILKKSYPYAILVLLMTFYNRIDGVMLERLLNFREGAVAAGIYAQAYRLLDAANMIAFLFAGLLLPIFARMLKLKQHVQEMTDLSFSLLVIPAVVVSVTCSFYSNQFMQLLYSGEHVRESAEVFRILMWCFVPISTTYIYGTLLTANGSLRQLNLMATGGMLLNIGLNTYLIPRYQAAGAAFSSLVTQSLTCLAQVVMVRLTFRFEDTWLLLARLTVFFCLSLAWTYFTTTWPGGWMMRFLCAALGCIGAALLMRLIDPRNIYRIVRYEEV
jgi:O-antigen/teichoic acid export membrane protein